jgi:hypothetical protein
VETVRGSGHPRGMLLVTRMPALQANRRGNQWHPRVEISVENRAPCAPAAVESGRGGVGPAAAAAVLGNAAAEAVAVVTGGGVLMVPAAGVGVGGAGVVGFVVAPPPLLYSQCWKELADMLAGAVNSGATANPGATSIEIINRIS